jgi:thymidylate synthase (FAD)
VSLAIYKLSSPQFHLDEFLKFLDSQGQTWSRTGTTDAEKLTEAAGRVCYMSFGPRQSSRSNREYIQNLIEQGHESVLEHVGWTLLLAGVSRAFTHQLVRHRIGFSFSQLSQQYHEETDAVFIEPPELRQSPHAEEAWQRAISVARESYEVILDALADAPKVPGMELQNREFTRAIRSAARSVLPNATETKIVVSTNARALRHFFEVRGAIVGDVEMREVSAAIFKLVEPDAPALFSDFSLTALPDATPVLRRQ